MQEIASIPFLDLSENDDGMAIIQLNGNKILLALTLKSNGDIQVAFDKSTAQSIVEALNKAVAKLSC